MIGRGRQRGDTGGVFVKWALICLKKFLLVVRNTSSYRINHILRNQIDQISRVTPAFVYKAFCDFSKFTKLTWIFFVAYKEFIIKIKSLWQKCFQKTEILAWACCIWFAKMFNLHILIWFYWGSSMKKLWKKTIFFPVTSIYEKIKSIALKSHNCRQAWKRFYFEVFKLVYIPWYQRKGMRLFL